MNPTHRPRRLRTPARITRRAPLPLCLALALACGPGSGDSAGTPADFQAAVQERVAAYEAFQSDPASLDPMLNGRYQEIHERLEALVPNAEKTAADHFVLGNMLYAVDPERSFSHHAAAFAELPSEPGVVLEMAYQHHRRGDCTKAMPHYAKLASIGWLSPERHALLAHCQLELGHPEDALASWQAAGFPERRAAIDQVIHQVFGDLAPLARHDALVQRVLARDEGAVGELLQNALEWRQDWWNAAPNMQAFTAAVAAVERGFGADHAIAREVRLLEKSLELEGTPAFGELLREEGLLLGDEGRLPTSSWVAKEWIHDALKAELLSYADLERHMPELGRRARSGEDLAALDIVARVLTETGRKPQLAEFDRLGWETYGEERFALSYLAGRKDEVGGSLDHDDRFLLEARDDFPRTPRIARIALVLATRAGQDTTEDVVRLIDAEYHGLRSDPSRGSTYLNAYFGELAKRLEGGQAEATAATSEAKPTEG